MLQYFNALGIIGKYLFASFALGGGIIMTLIITGWAWFQTYFKEFGIDIDSLNSDGSLGRIEYYLSPGAKSFGHLISGKLNKNINEYFLSEKFFGITVVFLIILLMYTLMRVEIHREKREDDSPKADLLPAKDGFKFFFLGTFCDWNLDIGDFCSQAGGMDCNSRRKEFELRKPPAGSVAPQVGYHRRYQRKSDPERIPQGIHG